MGVFKDLRDIVDQAEQMRAQYPVSDALANAKVGMAQAAELMQGLAATTSETTAGLVDGVETVATVTASRHTGTVVSFNPVIDLDLLVAMPNGVPRPVTRREVVAQLHLVKAQPGNRLRVKVDPNDVTRLWIDWNTLLPVAPLPTPPPPAPPPSSPFPPPRST
jgi:hypothetical protein